MKRKLLAAVACAVLVIQLAVPAGASGTVYFTAVNMSVLELSDATMPFWSNGYLYVPGSIFATYGKELGVSYSYNPAKEKVALYVNGETMRSLIFDLNKDYAEDQSGNMYFQKPVVRGGVIFLPVGLIAQCFGLLYSAIAVERGYLVWIRTQAVDLSERLFVDAATYPMETRYNQYLKSQETGQTETDSTEEDAVQSTSGQKVYLCVRASEGDTVSALLDVLDQYDSQAAFYCTVDFLEQEGALLRRMTATGHTVGIVADAAEPGWTVAEQLAAGNAALEAATCGKTRLARLENVSDQTAADVEAMGYCCLWPDLDRSPYPLSDGSSADVLLRRVGEQSGSVSVWLGDGASAAGLRAFLTGLRESGDRCLAMTETA